MAAATLTEVLEVLRARRDEARALGIELVGVVGSMARGEAREDSDVDIVFDPAPGFDYWRLGALISSLGVMLGRRVDMVDRQMMRPERWAWMSRDFIPLT
jgi:predicted nucleotidyltransferase